MLRFISTGLLCAASFISTHTFAASVSFDFMPHQSEVITNFTIFPIKATCLISLQNEQDNATLHVKALRREGTINNFPLKKGDEIDVTVHHGETITLSAQAAAQVEFTNTSDIPVKAMCHT
ncbi:MAG: hypothetical protein CMF38_01170 [Legionellaceae bacterium]|nr:hypothetical protein [Legionellaceae bacterium]HAF87882.1 hypothetical protein [Legionellales bacterium]HCA89368.1 hypothetical protein [Legionellales bacterium]|tara:strand:- start:1893 stop:2255 length:363 start_codon:yes stop_codon:yes gene_type:complete